MAISSSRLTDLTMADLERCYRIQEALDAADDAVKSASWAGKAAVRALLRTAYDCSIEIMRKGAPAALRKAEKGMWARKSPSLEFIQRLVSVAARPDKQPVEVEDTSDGNQHH